VEIYVYDQFGERLYSYTDLTQILKRSRRTIRKWAKETFEEMDGAIVQADKVWYVREWAVRRALGREGCCSWCGRKLEDSPDSNGHPTPPPEN